MNGPPVVLHAEIATPTSLILNELATNARKHGSLSVKSGHVDIHWSLVGSDLHLSWSERGGPPVELPLSPGMGTRLIRGFVDYQLRGSVEFSSKTEGLCCELVIPLEAGTA